MKYYIIAGEASGDMHASNLVAEIKKKDKKAEFRGFGGDMMQAQGVEFILASTCAWPSSPTRGA